MVRTLTDGEREIMAELNADATEQGEWVEVEVCRGCGCPVDDCDCAFIQQRREERNSSLLGSCGLHGRRSLYGEPF